MAESKFQWSLHRVDSHKSPARVCRVSIEVSKWRPSSFHETPSVNFISLQLFPHFGNPSIYLFLGKIKDGLTDFLCFIDMGCQWTSRLCCSSPTRRTWRSWERCSLNCTNTWTAVLRSLMWVSFTRSLTVASEIIGGRQVQLFDFYDNRVLKKMTSSLVQGVGVTGCHFRFKGLNHPLCLLPLAC